MIKTIGNKDLLNRQIFSQIRDAKILKQYEIGDKLSSEFELCSQLGVSCTVIWKH